MSLLRCPHCAIAHDSRLRAEGDAADAAAPRHGAAAAGAMELNERAATRARLRQQRERLPAPERVAAANGVARALENLPEFVVDPRVAGYWAVSGEVPLHAALNALVARGQRYHLPVLSAGKRLRFAPWRRDVEVRPNRHGIPEPQCAARELIEPDALDLVLVPLLGFDRRGNRLGTGGGYYDRSFAFLHGKPRPAQPLLVGIGYSFQEVSSIDPGPWDVKVDFVATEKELIQCVGTGERRGEKGEGETS